METVERVVTRTVERLVKPDESLLKQFDISCQSSMPATNRDLRNCALKLRTAARKYACNVDRIAGRDLLEYCEEN